MKKLSLKSWTSVVWAAFFILRAPVGVVSQSTEPSPEPNSAEARRLKAVPADRGRALWLGVDDYPPRNDGDGCPNLRSCAKDAGYSRDRIILTTFENGDDPNGPLDDGVARNSSRREDRRPIEKLENDAFPSALVDDLREAANAIQKNAKRERYQTEKERIDALEAADSQTAANASWVGSKAGELKTLTIKGVKYRFHWAPPGEFTMGSPKDEEGRRDDETQHTAKLSRGFWVLETEVTQAMQESVTGTNPSCFKGATLPAENVSWDDCQEFIKKANSSGAIPSGLRLSLPTETQWEYACRAGTNAAYFWGSGLNGDKANCNGNDPCGTTQKGVYLEKTTPVGSYSANAWGLFDMHGNVWEWCEDWKGVYPSGAASDPTGPSSGFCRVLRGGGWRGGARYCRSAGRNDGEPTGRDAYSGFRLVLVFCE